MGVPKRIFVATVSENGSTSPVAASQPWNAYTDTGFPVTDISTTSPVRKRQRLDHLTREEKILRRKMKNRVAAQCARDRKKAKMDELEAVVTTLQSEKTALLEENETLRHRLRECEEENKRLRERLAGEGPTSREVQEAMPVKERSASSGSIEYASLISGPLQKDQPDGLFAMLQECSESLLDIPVADTVPHRVAGQVGEQGNRQGSSPAPLVGPTPKELDSLKEMIQIDHVYSKRGDCGTSMADVSTHVIPAVAGADDDDVAEREPFRDAVLEVFPSADDEMSDEPFTHSSPLREQSPLRTVPSPTSSVETGYDSADSPLGEDVPSNEETFLDVNPWEDPLAELFPSLA